MPEFIMDTSGTVGHGIGHGGSLTWSDICEFNRGFIEALFFTETSPAFNKADWVEGESETDGSIPGDSCFGDIHPQSLARIWKVCHDFKNTAADLLEQAKALEPGANDFRYAKDSLDDRRLGQLFYYASQGHGVGFTDDGDADCLEKLQAMAGNFYGRSITYGESVHGGRYVFYE